MIRAAPRRRRPGPVVEELIARRAGGDARNALNILQLSETARAEGPPLAECHVHDAARKRPLAYDKGGDKHYDFILAWIKSTRAGSDPRRRPHLSRRRSEGGEERPGSSPLSPDDRARLGGHRERRPAGATRRGRSGSGGRARRGCPGSAPRRRSLPRCARAQVERVLMLHSA